jgi:hypothetical protein
MNKVYVLLIVLCSITMIYGQTFTDINAGLPGLSNSSAAWGDYDNDGDLDILIAGLSAEFGVISRIYRNDSGSFTDTGVLLQGVGLGSLAWGDYDNDGDLDILLTGYTGSEAKAKIYRNDQGSFIDTHAPIQSVYFSSVAWGDYDNDGDLDILLTGSTGSERISRIYQNNNGTFTDINAGLTGVSSGSIDWGDYDNDGDLDILLSGEFLYQEMTTKIYNNQGGLFSEIDVRLPGITAGSAVWVDYDSDGDLDILLTGSCNEEGYPPSITRIYRNDSGSFFDINAGLQSLYNSSADWGDYDNDGDLDILLIGCHGLGHVSMIYRNDSDIFIGNNVGLHNVHMGSAVWGDYDNDGDLDILLTGENTNFVGASRIYRNNSFNPSALLSTPMNLTTSFNDSTITFSWYKATDNETPQDGLSYNFYLGTESLQGDLKTSMSDNSSGYRRVVDLGNAQQNNSYTLNKALPNGKYFWSVQAVDHAFAGSEFAPEQSFVILSSPQNVQIKHKDDFIKLTWNEVPGAERYFIYASDDPESNFVNVSKQGIFYNLSWTQTIGFEKKFYYVVAVLR